MFTTVYQSLGTNSMQTWKRVGLVVVVVLIIIGAAIVRLTPFASFYPIPGTYRAYSVYDIRHILETGHEIRTGERTALTSYASGIYLGTHDILRHKVDSAIMLLLGLNVGDLETYYHYALWSPLIMFPLAALALTYALHRANGTQARPATLLPVLIFSLLGSFNMLSVSYHGESNTVTGWTFMLVAIYGLVRIPDNPVRGRVIFLMFSSLLTILYHTPAILLACVVLSLGIFSLRYWRISAPRSHSTQTMILVLLLIISHFMFVSVLYFRLFAKTLQQAPSLITFLLLQQSGRAPRDLVLADLLSTEDASFKMPMAILALMIALPVSIVILMGVCRRLRALGGEEMVRIIFPWLIGLLPFSIGLLLWCGFSGLMWKAGEFGSLFAVIALAALQSMRIGRGTRLALYTLMIACVGLSMYLFYTYQGRGPSHLTYAEQEAANWLASRAAPNEAVFTDLRLAAPLITADHLAVVGINDYDPPERVRQALDVIYYGTDSHSAAEAIRRTYLPRELKLRYAMFSRRAENNLPGIKGFDYNFKGAPAGYTDKFVQAPGFSLIYDNGTVRIFEVGGT